MFLTAVLSLAGCIAFFLLILGVTVTLPSPGLISFFPEDVQERLRPRVENKPMTFKRFMGWVILAAFCILYIGLFVYGAADGIKNGYSFWQFLLRFLIMGASIKVFDIVFFDYFILTRTRFFQHFFPETEGCRGWKDFGFNRKQQIRQCILIPVCCLICAFICTLL